MSFCLSNLILTGCATPYLQNGVVSIVVRNMEYKAVSWHRYYQFTEGKFGVPDKCDVGLLAWYSDTNTNRMLKVGFMVICIFLIYYLLEFQGPTGPSTLANVGSFLVFVKL